MISLLLVLPMVLMAQGSSLWSASSLAQTWDDNARIVGGSNAPDGAVPYQLSLRIVSNSRHICGGSILNADTILTAAHCIYHRKPEDLYVSCGINKLDDPNGKTYRLKTLILHEDYEPTTLKNDMAIIIPTETIEMSAKIQPIALSTSYVGAGVKCRVSGWGYIRYGNRFTPNDLKWLEVETISVKDCNTSPERLCTQKSEDKGTCKGDSGGPLVCGGELAGVVSGGTLCASGIAPDFYSRISAFIEWIKGHSNV